MGLFAERAKKKEEELNKALGKKMVYADDKSTSSLNNATTKTVVPTINKTEAVKSASDNLSNLERASRIGNIEVSDDIINRGNKIVKGLGKSTAGSAYVAAQAAIQSLGEHFDRVRENGMADALSTYARNLDNPNFDFESKPLDTSTWGFKKLDEANKLYSEALEGLSPAQQFLGQSGISILDNLSTLPLVAVHPSAPLIAMSAKATGTKAYELGKEGKSATEALGRGLVSGAIEGMTERLPLDELLDVIKHGGKVGQAALKQALSEGGEEALSYLLNLGADKLAGDDVDFSLTELGLSALGGVVSGGLMGTGGAMVGNLWNSSTYKNIGQKIVEDNIIEEVIQTGLESSPETESHKLAQQLQSKIEAGETVDEVEIGELYVENTKAIEEEEKASFKASYLGQNEDVSVGDKLATKAPDVAERSTQEAVDATGVTAKTKGRTNEKKLAAYKRSIDSTLSRISLLSEERQKYLRDKYELYKDKIEGASVGDVLYDADGVAIGEVVVKNEYGMTIKGEHIFEIIPYGTLSNETTLDTFLEMGGYFASPWNKAKSGTVNNVELTTADRILNNLARERVETLQQENEDKIYEAKKTLGENGAKALENFYDNNTDFNKYYKDFLTYYEAGNIGTPMDLIDNNYRSTVTNDIKFAAYVAGQNDAQISLERDKANGAVYHAYGGLVENNNSRKLSKTDRNFLDMYSSLTGNKTTLVDVNSIVAWEDEKGTQYAEGSYLKGDIKVEALTIDEIVDIILHESDHGFQKTAPAEYRVFRNYAVKMMEKNNGMSISIVEQYKKRYNTSTEKAMDEVASDFARRLFKNRRELQGFVEDNIKDVKGRTMLEKFFDAVQDVIDKIKKAFGKNNKSDDFKMIVDELTQARQLWLDMLQATHENVKKAQQNKVSEVAENVGNTHGQFSLKDRGQAVEINKTIEKVGISYDAETESVAPQFSLKTWNESDKVKAVKDLSKALGISKEEAQKYIDDVNGVAKYIANHKILDYESNDIYTAMKPNSDYKYTIDFSTLCKKRLLQTGTIDAIQHKLPNAVLTSDDYVRIRQLMKDKGYEVACGLCYVESRRRMLDSVAKGFIDKYMDGKSGLNIDDLTTTDGITSLMRTNRDAYDAFVLHNNARGMNKINLVETRVAYNENILKLTDKTVKTLNAMGGLRVQSFSDFEMVHLIDMMQVALDMSKKGLKSQAYTKVPAFAELMGNTGMKVNLSLIAKGVGYDSKGRLLFDDVEGMPFKTAMKLRNKFSKNVGTILVGINDRHIELAMADDRIDYIIPYHRSGWAQSEYEALGISGYEDYTKTQNEKLKDPYQRDKNGDVVLKKNGKPKEIEISNIYPSEYWDFNKTGEENAQRYLELCEEKGRIPKFPQFAYDAKGNVRKGYWKLLIDFKMYDNDGVGSPQMNVQPNFDTKAINKIMQDYVKGEPMPANKLPVAQDIVDEFVAEYKESGRRFSLKDSNGNQLTEAQAEFFKDSKVRDENGNLKVMYHGTSDEFTVFNPFVKGGKNGIAEGYGIYFADTEEVTDAYGTTRLEGYLNVTKPASSNKKTIKKNDLVKLIKATAQAEAKQFVDESGYDNVNEALRDTWISNYVDTYGMSLPEAYRQVADLILSLNHDDMNIVQEVMVGLGIRDYEAAYKFYDILKNTLGIDGFVTEWENKNISSGKAQIVVAFDSNQFKNTDNLNPTDDADIRFQLKNSVDSDDEDDYNRYRWAIDNGLVSKEENAVFFENIAALKRGDKFKKTYDGFYMIPTGERGINNVIIITDGDYEKPSIESVIRINSNNETDVSRVREDIYESKSGVRTSFNSIIRSYEEEGIFVEYNRNDIWMFEEISSEIGRENGKSKRVHRNNSGQRNRRGSSSEDKRLSLKDTGDILKENAALKEYNEYLKSQMRLTKEIKVDQKELKRLVNSLAKEYGTTMPKDEMFKRLDELYTYMQNEKELTFDDAKERAIEVARDIVSESVAVDDDMYKRYVEIRDFIRKTRITLSEEDRKSVAGGYNNFRKANMGRLNLANEGVNVADFYQQLSEMYPDIFDAEKYTYPADQLENIVDELNRLRNAYEYNPYDADTQSAVEWMANDIIDRYFDVPQAKPTYADKQKAKYDKQRRTQVSNAIKRERELRDKRLGELRKEKNNKIKEIRKKRDEKIKALKEAQKKRVAKMSDKRKRKILRDRIARHTKDLSTRLLKGSDKSHVPKKLRQTVVTLLDAINLESAYSKDPETGKLKKNIEGNPTKRTNALRELKEQYKEIIKTEYETGMVIDPALLGDEENGSMFDAVIKMKDTRISDMTLEELETVWKVIRAVEKSITSAGKTLSDSKYATTKGWAEAFKNDTSDIKERKSNPLKDISIDLETPYTFFAHFGQAGKDFFRMLRNAQDKQQILQDELKEKIRKVVSSEKREALEKDIVDYTTENGKKLMLSKAHLMEIYLLSKRKQARGHLLGDGIVQPKIKQLKIREGTEFTKLTENDLANIEAKLSDEEKRIADELQKITLFLAEKGNEASMLVFGYEKFNDPNYWTIKSSSLEINQTVEKGHNQPRSIKNMGSAKELTKNATNSLSIGGIFNTFDAHASDMITYSAWLAPMEDANRLFNFSFKYDNGEKTGKTIKGLLSAYAGEKADQYWLNLMEDIQNGIASIPDDNISSLIGREIGKVKGAAVASNIRVIVQQPTSFIRAGVVLSPDNMLLGMTKGVNKGNGWEKAKKYAPIARIKEVGGFEVSSSPAQLSEVLYAPETKKGKVLQSIKELPTMGASKADAMTWGAIWNACEWQVHKSDESLDVGSDEFNKAVAELFTEVIDQTQVVDGVLQRSQIMRSSKDYNKQATSFMGEPTLSLNLLMRSYDNWKSQTDPKKRTEARKKMGQAVFTLMLSNFVVAVAQSSVDGLRDDDEEKKYLERFLSALTGIQGDEESLSEIGKNMLLDGNLGESMNVVAWIPYVKELFSIAQGYDVERLDASAISDFVSAANNSIKSLSGEGKWSKGYALGKMFMTGAKLFGSSASNVVRDVESIVRSVFIETEDWKALYDMKKQMYNIKTQKGEFMDVLYKAYANGSDDYTEMYNDLLEQGISEKDIKSAMESRMKKAQNVDSVYELEERWFSPSQQKETESVMNSARKSSLWNKASQTQKTEFESRVYEILNDKETQTKMKEIGMDTTDYALFNLALSVYDEPNKNGNYGTYTNKETAEAILNTPNITDKEMASLWNWEMDDDNILEALNYGYDIDTYLELKADTTGLKKAEKRKYLNDMDISDEEYKFYRELLKL